MFLYFFPEKTNQLIKSPGLQPSLITYTSLIKASARCGDLPSAEAWLREAEASGLRLDIQILTAVIDAAARTPQHVVGRGGS